MYASQVLTQELYPRIVDKIRSLAGGALIMLPSSERDWGDPELAAIIAKTQRSPTATPRDRVKFLKGARYVSCSHSFRTYDWAAADALVDALLEDARL
jgi:4-hydroxyphenylacetate 3-monooxygenase